MINATAITGSGEYQLKPDDPEYALTEFYRAFNGRDLELMSSNWDKTETASMSNPLGGVKRGWNEIKQVYERIFNGGAEVYVEFYDYTINQAGEMFVAVGRERGYFQRGEEKIELSIRTSRTYRMDCGRWQQIHHHGSIDDPVLLKQYQTAVMGK